MKYVLEYQMEGLPPGVNAMYRNAGRRGRVLTKDGAQWKAKITKHVTGLLDAMEVRPVLTKKDRLGIDIILYTKLPLQFDWDGKVKIIQDCTMNPLGLDDRYIFEGSVRKVPAKENGFAVKVWKLP